MNIQAKSLTNQLNKLESSQVRVRSSQININLLRQIRQPRLANQFKNPKSKLRTSKIFQLNSMEALIEPRPKNNQSDYSRLHTKKRISKSQGLPH